MKHHKEERTLVVIKPDGIQRALIGEILGRYERTGLKLIGLKLLKLTPEFVESHYTLDNGWKESVGEKSIKGYLDKDLTPPTQDPIEIADAILARLKKYLTAGPVVAMVWQGAHAVSIVRKITGGTEPLMSPVGTIRGDYVLDSYQMTDIDDRAIRNLVHASGSPEEADNEIKHWFSDVELISYNHLHENILYSKEIEGIF